MLDLAIPVDTDQRGATVVETNRSGELKARRWPQDCEFQLVAYDPGKRECDVVWTESLAKDIACALQALERAGLPAGPLPDWHRRLALCAAGAGLS